MYHTIPDLEYVYLEDSYVTGLIEQPHKLIFKLDLVLLESHPLYRVPLAGEQYCYRPALLEFPNLGRMKWIQRCFDAFYDATKTVDYGNIDTFQTRDGLYHLEGDWGIVEIESDMPSISFLDSAEPLI